MQAVGERKHCPTCGMEQPLANFHRDRSRSDGLAHQCKSCANKYRQSYDRRRSKRLRQGVMEAYGGHCSCCEETELSFLTIDHINGGGARHRREVGGSFYRYLRGMNYPQDGYQVLCFNCNSGRATNGGICPHQEK